MGLYLFVDDKVIEKNKIEQLIKSKGYSLADISRMTGISKQNISNLLTTTIPPNIEYILKIAYVLDVPVESLYDYNKVEWYIPYNQDENLSYYFDMSTMELILNKTRKERIEDDGYTYLIVKENKKITDEEMKDLEREYLSFDIIKSLAQVKMVEERIPLSKAKKIVKEEQLILFKEEVKPIYYKVYKKIKPKKVKNKLK